MDRQSAVPIDPAGIGRGGIWSTLRNTTFRSLRTRNYRFYFFGQLISFTGSWMQSAALMWLVFDRTNDPIWPPMMLVAQVGPTLFLGTLGGALADRMVKLRLVFLTQCAFLGTSATLAGLVACDFATPWLLLSMNLLNGLIQAVDLPARLAFVPDLVPKVDLINAVSLNSLLFNSARAVGPAMAGVLFLVSDAIAPSVGVPAVRLGAFACLAINALSYFAVLAALRRIRVPDQIHQRGGSSSVWDGFRYVWQRPLLAILILATGALCSFGWPALTLFPPYTRQVLGRAEKEYSLLVSALGSGALIAALTTATFGTAARRGVMLSTGAFGTAGGLFGLSMATDLWQALLSASLGGFGLILFLSTGQSTLQMSATPAMRGRVMALWAMMLSASAPLGHLVAGFAAQSYPIRDLFQVMATGLLLCALAVSGLSLFVGWAISENPVEADAKMPPGPD